MCGGTTSGPGKRPWAGGLSPRVRGNQPPADFPGGQTRSIPACAGEPCRCIAPNRRGRVYPRVCGGTAYRWAYWGHRAGLSPRVRGNRRGWPPRRHPAGSIPACAGEPRQKAQAARASEVYPRVCGGTPLQYRQHHLHEGLSPRVRGNRARDSRYFLHPGSIPACAGEPERLPSPATLPWVYPRVCGGTYADPAARRAEEGLSPRVRGNRRHRLPGGTASGVYPRVCGGTPRVRGFCSTGKGLSPRVRGNHMRAPDGLAMVRSIPACAGEPPPASVMVSSQRVYPRVCGGTPDAADQNQIFEGLSPRVRGNPGQCPAAYGRGGSIPACAGEPQPPQTETTTTTVYPRVCGGTGCGAAATTSATGLSPRVRGNPGGQVIAGQHQRSIPACAGEPGSSGSGTSRRRVYPRVCGGTPVRLMVAVVISGSIPACAGEPRQSSSSARWPRVYPRVCGGTRNRPPPTPVTLGLSPRVRGNPTFRPTA